MHNVRIGIIGLGNIGKKHAEYLLADEVRRATLTAVCSSSPEKLGPYRARGVQTFATAQELLGAGAVDAVLIATPHDSHPALGLAAFAAGLHVLMEKPIAAQVAEAEPLLAAARAYPRLKFAAMFQQRTEPAAREIRARLQAGALGELVRVNWIATDWFRPEAYYRSGGWRATWAGEGGGVLLNQALHNLDLLAWLCGPPARVRGFCRLGRFHNIEVEDDATAHLEWPGGATGIFVASTGEAPGTNRLEITGTRGRLVWENGKLVLTRNAVDSVEFSRTAQDAFARPAATTEELFLPAAGNPHAALTQNFVDAILDDTPLLAPGADGRHSLELANAIVYSSLIDATVALPLAGAAWAGKLNELIATAKAAKKTLAT